MDKNRVQGVSVGRAADLPWSPYPSSTRSVDPATVRGRRLNLPREICFVPRKRLRLLQGWRTAEQKSAEGIRDPDVGKASEALRSERWSKQIGQAGNGDQRPEREGGE